MQVVKKGSVVKAAREVLGKNITNFIPGHPIAGTEKKWSRGLFQRTLPGSPGDIDSSTRKFRSKHFNHYTNVGNMRSECCES